MFTSEKVLSFVGTTQAQKYNENKENIPKTNSVSVKARSALLVLGTGFLLPKEDVSSLMLA